MDKVQFPLEKLKILDLTRLIPGGYATLILADLGAEVVKVEDTQSGDYARWYPPPVKEYGIYFHALNRNKKSIKLNLKAKEGKDIFKKLLAGGYDIIVESFRPGVMDRLGLGYKPLREINPGIIYCAITGYGQEGPRSDKAAHDLNCIAVAGALGITGRRGEVPSIPGVQIADTGSSLFAVISILAAVIGREKSGLGQFIDVSMTDGVVSVLSVHLSKYLLDGQVPKPQEMHLTGRYPCYRIYEAKDGGAYLTLAALEEKFWKGFCEAVGREDLIPKQFDDSEEAHREVEEVFRSKTRREWEEISRRFDFCLEAVKDFGEVTREPQLKERGVFFEITHLKEGSVPQVRIPFRMSDMDDIPKKPPPGWGEHTKEILLWLGYTEEEIEELEGRGVV